MLYDTIGEIPSFKIIETDKTCALSTFLRFARARSLMLCVDADTLSSTLDRSPKVTPSSFPNVNSPHFLPTLPLRCESHAFPALDHGAKLHDIPDEHLLELLPIAKKIAVAVGSTDYNILQNNGRIAHQMVDHVHFHFIPKPTPNAKEGEGEESEEGLVVGWPIQKADMAELKAFAEEIKGKL